MKCLVKSIATMHFILCCGLAALAASPQSRLEIYQNEIRNKDSGVYEVGGDLYAHVKVSIGRKESHMRVKQKAILKANELLKKWAIDYTAMNRKGACALPAGWCMAVAMLDGANPMWRFSGWNVNITGQEYTGRDGGVLWFGQVVSREDLIQKIPESFSTPTPDQEQIIVHLKRYAPKLKKLDAVDLLPDSEMKVAVQREQREVEKQLGDYLEHSPVVAEIKKRKVAIARPVIDERWTEKEVCSPSSLMNNEVSVTTNRVSNMSATTNRVDRLQTNEERMEMGVAESGVLHVDSAVSEMYEIITRDIATTAVVKKVCRCKVISVTTGTPRFEEIFLSSGCAEIEERRQTSSGRNAVAVYFGNKESLESKDTIVRDALCENPGDVLLWNVFGLSRLRHNDTLGALICFRIALKLNPTDQSALTNLAIAYDKLNFRELTYLYASRGLGVSTDVVCQKTCKQLLGE